MVERLGVIGSGTMGAGIAQVAAGAGYQVRLHDVSEERLSLARAAIESSLQRFVKNGSISESDVSLTLSRITFTTDLAAVVEDASIVVEAAFEDLAVKVGIFKELSALCGSDVILASNTSALPITQIAAVVDHPERVVGTHFFSPVPMMKLCELVRGEKTSDVVLARAREFATNLGKTCIVVNRDVAGFVTTRLIAALILEASRLVESGVATAEDIDIACQLGFGHAMGPLRTADLTGIDIIRNASMNIFAEDHDERWRPTMILDKMVEEHRLGRKSGNGFYAYE
ncbi:MAG TPA: 3-hydroxyacyl-CoA dehydrogenase family protein [Candidatus Nanopelagicaceae bacterium]|nr:3-hydroxyacyl-CoA dehydrogenase family protein [Candidatus Nanopelagicaceae bacterium]